MNSLRLLFFLFLIGISSQMLSGQNVSQVKVSELSDTQIERIIQEIENNGLNQSQAVTLAKARGASQSQIDELFIRIQELDSETSLPDQTLIPSANKIINEQNYSTKAEIFVSETNKKIFGFDLFNSSKLTFEPALNIPTSKNYELGIGDELLITVWGASQATYQLRINSTGAILVPELGPVYLNGESYESARQKIKERLIKIYSGLKGDVPNTWCEVNIVSVRSIKVNIIGEANAPGTYTLPSTASAFNALYLSGGPNENGSFRNIRLIRDGEIIQLIDIYDFLINSNISSNVQLREQDILFIPAYESRVEITGSFKRSGFFEFKKEESLAKVIKFAGGFANKAYQKRISITRNTFNEMKVIDVSKNEFKLFKPQNGDVIFADSLINRYENRISITGSVFRPGFYAWEKGMKLSQLIAIAEGVKEEAYRNRAYISRRMPNWEWEHITFSVAKVESGEFDMDLQAEDVVTIRSRFDLRENQTITIVGHVQNPGNFPYKAGLTLKDVVLIAGGFNEQADISYIDIARRLSHNEAAHSTDTLIHIFTFPVSRDLQIQNEKFEIMPFDKIFIRRAPGYNSIESATISGEVIYAGDYPLKNKNERISDLIKRANGLTNQAYLKGATLSRRINLSDEEKDARKALMEQDSTLNLQLYGTEMVGIDLSLVLENKGSNIDLILLPGDQINIPQKFQTVKISGNVMNPISLTFEKGKDLRSYVNSSGGFGRRTLKSNIYVIYPNGITKRAQGSILGRKYPPILPGSEIIVPQKPEKVNYDQTSKWLAITSTLSTLAVALKTFL